ncbi:MAG: carbon-nitrogen hydrolase family protein [Anaerolineae bacterium]
MPSALTIALLQLCSHGRDQDANLVKGETACRQARQMGTDIALFPEMWNIGYRFFDPKDPADRDAWLQQAIDQDSAFVRHFQQLARELDMAIALTYLERWEGAPRNSVSLIDRHGEIPFTYAKVHTCDFGEESALTPGDDFHVGELDTRLGPVQIGAMICYDREFPESARILMLKGAEIILTPNACELESHRLHQFKTRAYENMVGVAMANYAAPECNGHSVAYDAEAFGPDGQPRDTLIIEAGPSEGIYLARFDLDRLRDYRRRETWGNAYRKPSRYGILTSPEVAPPFVRPDARR